MEERQSHHSHKYESKKRRHNSSDSNGSRARGKRSPDRHERDQYNDEQTIRSSDKSIHEGDTSYDPRQGRVSKYDNGPPFEERSRHYEFDADVPDSYHRNNDRNLAGINEIDFDRPNIYTSFEERSPPCQEEYYNHKSPENNIAENISNHFRSGEEESFENDNSNSRAYNRNDHYHPKDGEKNLHKSYERQNSYQNASNSEFGGLLKKVELLEKQVESLLQENKQLRLNKLSESAAEVTVKFHNKKFEEKFSSVLKEIATDLITGRCTVEALTEYLNDTNTSRKHSESWNPEGELFSLDVSCDEPKENSLIPRYDNSFNQMLESPAEEEEAKEEISKEKQKSIGVCCFNCGENHLISKCPEPMDYEKIANAKKEFRATSASFQASNKRYHVQEEEELDIKPGVISDELREALGVHPSQIPPYIYRMRILDYPPGWLAEAEVERSGITLYDSAGAAEPTANGKQNGDGVQYDPKKLIDFPGFNAPLPLDVIDESLEMGLPPMQTYQLRDFIEQTLPKADIPELPSRKRKLELPPPKNVKSLRVEENMELDSDLEPTVLEFNPPLPEDDLPPPPPEDFVASPPPENPINGFSIASSPDVESDFIDPFKINEDSSGNESPSLHDLEEIKKRLEMELDMDGDGSNQDSAPNARTPEEDAANNVGATKTEARPVQRGMPLASEEKSGLAEGNVSIANDSCYLSANENSNELSNQSDGSVSSRTSFTMDTSRTEVLGSRLVTLGTPSISRHSPYSRLPNYSNFSKDVTEHMNFENLPDSTGTYQKMKQVLKKVKEKINSMMQ